MKAHVTIDLGNPMALPLLGFLESLPFTEVEKKNKKFDEAARQCKGVPLSDFSNELHRQIDEYYDKLEPNA